MNFGIGHTLNRFKYLIIGGTLAMGFMFIIETILFIPCETTISSCSVPNLYSDQYPFFVTLMIGTISGIMILIVCVTVSTSRHIWRIFFTKLKVNPRDNEVSSLNVESIGRAKIQNSNCENEEQRTEVVSVTEKLMSPTNTSQLNCDKNGRRNEMSSATDKWTIPIQTLVFDRDNDGRRNEDYSATVKWTSPIKTLVSDRDNDGRRKEDFNATVKWTSPIKTLVLDRDNEERRNEMSSVTEKLTNPIKTLVLDRYNEGRLNEESSVTDKWTSRANSSQLHCYNEELRDEVSSVYNKLTSPTNTEHINYDSEGRRNKSTCHNEHGEENKSESLRLSVHLQDNVIAHLRSDENNSNIVNEHCQVVSETSLSRSMLDIKAEMEMKHTSNIRVQQLINHMKTARISCNQGIKDSQCTLNSQILTKKPQFTFDAWEFRAFITSIIVAVTTIVLTGPFLVSYWIDYYTGTLLPQQVRFILLIPLVLNSILNPFIYAWRIPEIKQQFQKLFHC